MNLNWQHILYSLPGIIIGLTVHEYCHAFASYKLGDHTARDQGRLTFNPLRHIDLIGFLFIIFAGFGWAKPVQFNPGNLRNLRRDKAIIAAAGPISNFLLALVFIVIFRVLFSLISSADNEEAFFSLFSPNTVIIFMTIIFQAAAINLGLFIFNLLPIPPLDGSHIVFSGLNISAETELKLMKIGVPLLFVILIVQNQAGITILPIGRIVSALLNFFLA